MASSRPKMVSRTPMPHAKRARARRVCKAVSDETLSGRITCSSGVCCVDGRATWNDCLGETSPTCGFLPIASCNGAGECTAFGCASDGSTMTAMSARRRLRRCLWHLQSRRRPERRQRLSAGRRSSPADGTCAAHLRRQRRLQRPRRLPEHPPGASEPAVRGPGLQPGRLRRRLRLRPRRQRRSHLDFLVPGAEAGVHASWRVPLRAARVQQCWVHHHRLQQPGREHPGLLFYSWSRCGPGYCRGAPFDATLRGVAQFPVTSSTCAAVVPAASRRCSSTTQGHRFGAFGRHRSRCVLGFDAALDHPGSTPLCSPCPATHR